MIIRNKFNGYVNGTRLYPGGGGGPSTTTSYQTNIPPYLKPYVKTMLGAAEKQIYTGGVDEEGVFQPTGFKPFKSFGEYDIGRGGTGESVAGFTPMQVQAMRGVQGYQLPGQTGQASELTGYAGLGALGAGQQYAQQATSPGAIQAYMSPYIQGALAPQMEEARRQYGITQAQTGAEAAQRGAFGGSRQGLVEAENARNLAKQQEAIYGQGMQNAFQAAQQAQQFGANLGLQGYGQAAQAAGQLGALGQQQYQQEMGLLGQQAAMGKQQQEYEQARLNQIIQDYATAQQYPFMQLGILNSMLRGLPMQSATTSMYQAQPANLQQLVGTAGALSELGKRSAEGGVIKEMASGGIASGVDPYKLPSMAKKLSDDQLQKKITDPETDPDTMGIMQAESQRRKDVRGMASGGVVAFAGGGNDEVKNPFKDDEEPKGMFPISKGAAKGEPAIAPNKPAKQSKAPKSEGIMAKPAPAKENDEDFYGRYQKRMEPALAEARKQDEFQGDLLAARQKAIEDINKTDAQRVQEQQDKMKAAGANTDFMDKLRKTYSNQLDKMTEETNEQRSLRRAQAWAIFGSTPGPMLKVGLQALNAYIDQEIEDDKARKKARNELNKAIYEVDHADYLIKAGQIEKADAAKSEAFKRVDSLNDKLAALRQRDREAQLQVSGRGAEAAMGAEARIKEQKIQSAAQVQAARERSAGADKEEKSIQAQTRAARTELQKWDNSEEGKSLARAESMLANPNLKGDARKTFEGDRDRLQSKRDALKREVMKSYPDARLEEPAVAPSGGGSYNYVPGKGLVPAK